jgi:hypothetical protein
MGWYIFFVVWGVIFVYCLYELLTAPLIKDDEKPIFFSEEKENKDE